MPNTRRQVHATASDGWTKMPRISINEMTTYRWSFLEDVTGYQALGVQSLGLWRPKLSDFGEERGIELLRESGLAVSSVWTAGGFTGSDGQTFREAVDDALEALRLAAEVRAGCLVVVSGARASHTLSHARRLVRDALLELGDAAARSGLSVAVQPLRQRPHDRCSFLPSLDAALELLEWCDHPQVGLVFDFLHLWQEPDLCRRVPDVLRWIKIAALCDARLPARSDDDRCFPGEGRLPLGEMVAALETAGYRGLYDVQLLGRRCWDHDCSELVRQSLDALESICPRTFPRPRPEATRQASRPDVPLAASDATIATPATPPA